MQILLNEEAELQGLLKHLQPAMKRISDLAGKAVCGPGSQNVRVLAMLTEIRESLPVPEAVVPNLEM